MKNKEWNLQHYIKRYNTNIDQLSSFLSEQLALCEEDTLIVCGSVVDGVANSTSDLDFYLITNNNSLKCNATSDIFLELNGCSIDIRVVPDIEVRDLISEFNHWESLARIPRNGFVFQEDQMKFFHRFTTGIPILGKVKHEELKSTMNSDSLLRLKLDRAVHLARNIQVDLEGLRADGDFRSMLPASIEILGHTIDTVLAAAGNSSPNKKWRMRHLQKLGENSDLNMRISFEGDLSEFYFHLLCIPNYTSSNEYLRKVHEILDMCRIFMAISERLILNQSAKCRISFPKYPFSLPQNDTALSLDSSIVFEGGRFILCKLNSVGEMLPLTEGLFHAYCQYVGLDIQWDNLEQLKIDDSDIIPKFKNLIHFYQFNAKPLAANNKEIASIINNTKQNS